MGTLKRLSDDGVIPGRWYAEWLAAWAIFAVGIFVGQHCSVGGREQSSTEVATATTSAPSSSALVPAPTWAGDDAVGGLGSLAEKPAGSPAETEVRILPEPASTVTQSLMTATASTHSYTGPSVTVIDPVPATPVASAAPVETLAPASNNYAPWPVELWPMVACLIERESRGNPSVTGAQGERGLMQIGPANFAYLAERGIAPDQLYDGPTNIRAGWLLYLYWQDATGDGFYPWKSTRGGC